MSLEQQEEFFGLPAPDFDVFDDPHEPQGGGKPQTDFRLSNESVFTTFRSANTLTEGTDCSDSPINVKSLGNQDLDTAGQTGQIGKLMSAEGLHSLVTIEMLQKGFADGLHPLPSSCITRDNFYGCDGDNKPILQKKDLDLEYLMQTFESVNELLEDSDDQFNKEAGFIKSFDQNNWMESNPAIPSKCVSKRSAPEDYSCSTLGIDLHSPYYATPIDEHLHEATRAKKRRVTDDNIENGIFWDFPSFLEEECNARFRSYQADQWYLKFGELKEFKRAFGHCQVPHSFQQNPTLARWAKRQRYQYKLLQEGKASTMTEERVAALEDLGFVWDSHSSLWFERLGELKHFRQVNGHCNVPSSYPANPKLAIWVKCQRRQYKLLKTGQPSNMTLERANMLDQLGFIWEIRRINGKAKI